MKRFAYLVSSILLACSLGSPALALEPNTTLFIGIEKNRRPYTYLDEEQNPKGILLDAFLPLCKTIGVQCNFVAGDVYSLLDGIKNYELHGFIAIDSFFIPDVDKIKLTPPICKLKPVFIQRASEPARQKPEDFKKTTIGVLEGSLLHFYLLDEYSSFSRLRPYTLLENGVFDLVSGRIDALFADDAFFKEQVLKTSLGQEGSKHQLVAFDLSAPKLPTTSMRIAIRERDSELLGKLGKALLQQTKGPTPECADLSRPPSAGGSRRTADK